MRNALQPEYMVMPALRQKDEMIGTNGVKNPEWRKWDGHQYLGFQFEVDEREVENVTDLLDKEGVDYTVSTNQPA